MSVTVSSAITSIFLAESSIRHSAKSLPSAQQKTLGKEAFADPFFAVSSLPSATLSKRFTEWLCCFAECVGHSANEASPVVAEGCGERKTNEQTSIYRNGELIKIVREDAAGTITFGEKSNPAGDEEVLPHEELRDSNPGGLVRRRRRSRTGS
jgi:hypothetical protein